MQVTVNQGLIFPGNRILQFLCQHKGSHGSLSCRNQREDPWHCSCLLPLPYHCIVMREFFHFIYNYLLDTGKLIHARKSLHSPRFNKPNFFILPLYIKLSNTFTKPSLIFQCLLSRWIKISHSSLLKPCWARCLSMAPFPFTFHFSSQTCIISKPSTSVFNPFTVIVYEDFKQYQIQCPSLRNSSWGQFQIWLLAISQQQLWAQQPGQFLIQLVAFIWSVSCVTRLSTKVLWETLANDLLKLW